MMLGSFSSFLKDEVENIKKRKKPSDHEEPSEPAAKRKKYVRRGVYEKERERKYLEEQESERLAKREKDRKEMEQLREKFKEEEEQVKKEDEPVIPMDTIKRRLNQRDQPISYFGETDDEIRDRLHQLDLSTPMEYDMQADFSTKYKDTNLLAELDEFDVAAIEKKKELESDRNFVLEDREPEDDVEEVWFFFKEQFHLQGKMLEARSEGEKKSMKGRADTRMYAQTRSYLKPFFRRCRKRTVENDILDHMANIVRSCKKKDYVGANSEYYRLAIGNSAWPVGVTGYGIHARAADDRIVAEEVAHVLNDETQRNYISACKRLVTFYQSRYPNIPSRTVQ